MRGFGGVQEEKETVPVSRSLQATFSQGPEEVEARDSWVPRWKGKYPAGKQKIRTNAGEEES